MNTVPITWLVAVSRMRTPWKTAIAARDPSGVKSSDCGKKRFETVPVTVCEARSMMESVPVVVLAVYTRAPFGVTRAIPGLSTPPGSDTVPTTEALAVLTTQRPLPPLGDT